MTRTFERPGLLLVLAAGLLLRPDALRGQTPPDVTLQIHADQVAAHVASEDHEVGIANEGFWGIAVSPNTKYHQLKGQ